MPFDNTSGQVLLEQPPVRPVANTLAALGIQPVPREVADAYMAEVLEQFRNSGPQEASLVQNQIAYWATRWISPCRDSFRRNPDHTFYHSVSYEPSFKQIRKQLRRSAGGDVSTPDCTAAPAAIIKVAAEVHRSIEDAKFSVAFFFDDPILNVTYPDQNGDLHHDCLGIWDSGKVVALAVMPARPLFARLFSFFG